PGEEGNGGAALLEGFETTSAEFGQVDLDGAGDVPSLRDEVAPESVQPMAELEPTVPAGADETDLDVELEPMLEHEIEIEPTPSPVPPPAPPKPAPGPDRLKRKAVVEVPPLELEPDFDTASTEAAHQVDEQPLAVEDIPPTGGFIQTEEDTSLSETRRSAFIDLGLDGVVSS